MERAMGCLLLNMALMLKTNSIGKSRKAHYAPASHPHNYHAFEISSILSMQAGPWGRHMHIDQQDFILVPRVPWSGLQTGHRTLSGLKRLWKIRTWNKMYSFLTFDKCYLKIYCCPWLLRGHFYWLQNSILPKPLPSGLQANKVRSWCSHTKTPLQKWMTYSPSCREHGGGQGAAF